MTNQTQKKPVLRMCVACRSMKDKDLLVRIVKAPDGEVKIDKTFKAFGRGAYICKDKTCIAKCIKTRQLNRSFKCEVKKSVYDLLSEAVEIE